MPYRRPRLTSAPLAAILLCGALAAVPAALAAQDAAAAPAPADTTLRPYRLTTVVVTAERHDGILARVWRGIGARGELAALARENRALEYRVRAYDARIAKLERRVAELRAPRDSMLRQIASADSATALVRLERRRLEARVRALEVGGGGSD